MTYLARRVKGLVMCSKGPDSVTNVQGGTVDVNLAKDDSVAGSSAGYVTVTL